MTHGSPKDSPQQLDEPDIEALIEAIRKPGETDAQLWARMGAAQNYLRRWGVHEPDQPDEPVDPVARMNAQDERQQLEVFSLDRELDQQQDRLDQLMHDDPLGVIAFDDRPGWIEKRLRRE